MSKNYDDTEGVKPDEPVVVRDRRKIDPETGTVRSPESAPEEQPVDGAAPVPEPTADAEPEQSDVDKQLAERTADLQRVQAEYANYRKRVERDREMVVQAAKASVVNELLPLLDDVQRAEQHGDLTGAFKAVADKLVANLQAVGLESFGAEGDTFDPSVHEAVQHTTSSEVDGPTVTAVLRRGFKFGERVLRPAMVAVTDHEPEPEPKPDQLVEPSEPAESSTDN